MQEFNPAWYRRLHQEVNVRVLDLKTAAGRASMDALLLESDILVTAQRPSALARMGLGARSLAERFPRLCHVAIVGHAPPEEERAGHDLTYLAEAGLLSPPSPPATLYADMAGAERAVTTALALVLARDRGDRRARPTLPSPTPPSGSRSHSRAASPRPVRSWAAGSPDTTSTPRGKAGSRSPRSSRTSRHRSRRPWAYRLSSARASP